MWDILTGQFFWGVVVGLLLSFFGAWLLAKFTVSRQQAYQKKVVVEFCKDTIKTLRRIITEMGGVRDRGKEQPLRHAV